MQKLNNARCFAIGVSFLCLTTNHPSIAQIVPDATLPNNSIAIPNGNSIRIEGGTSAGSNLFHSFQEFSVPTGSEAFFNNGLDIQNIFSRITGSNISNIDGLIRANGTANLFLINPNGIIFGQNAQLNIGGSFLSSTANSIKFADGSEFSATNPTAPSLLTVNVPVGLQFGANPARIVNRSTATAELNLPTLPFPLPFDNKVGLAVAPGQTLALVGGDIQLDGGNLTASTGQIILGSVASPGRVNFTPNPFGLTLNYDNISNFGNIEILNGTIINTTGLGGGKVDIRGGNVSLNGGRIYGLTLGNIDGRGIDINAQKFRAEGGAQISTLTLGDGAGGAVSISGTDSVELIGIGIENFRNFVANFAISGSLNPFDPQIILLTSTSGMGNAGNITIDTGRLLIDNGSASGSATLGAGNAGNMTIRARVFDMVGSGINSGTITGSTGKGGSFTFEGESLIVRDGSGIVSITRTEEAAGNINIQASESVELLRTPAGAILETTIATNSLDFNGNAGDININTKRLTISDGAGITSENGGIVGNILLNVSGGVSGNLTIQATESIELAGISGVLANGGQSASLLSSATFSDRRGGDIRISTPVLTLLNGGLISTRSLGAGDAGNITIDAGRVEVIGTTIKSEFNTAIQATVGFAGGATNPNATGNAGQLNLNVGQLIIRDGATVSVQASGSGNAGNLNVTANEFLLDNGGTLNGATDSGAGANINLNVQNIQLRRDGGISTNARSSEGGNITINTDTLAALENSDITANAVRGSGGRVSITTQGIFGTQFRDALTPNSDITATSDLGAQFSGTVEINTPDVDPSSGLLELSGNLADVTNQIATACPASGDNSFVVTGRGGLPVDPTQTLPGRTVWRDVRSLGTGNGVVSNLSMTNSSPGPIEVTGWQRNQKGEVELVVNASGVSSGSPWNRVAGCGVR